MAHTDRPCHLDPDKSFIFQKLEFEEDFSLDLATAIEQLFGDVQTAAQTIAPLVAVIGFIGLGVMYMGSSWPIIGDWKKDNPKAANQVVVGLLFVIFASSVTTLISFT